MNCGVDVGCGDLVVNVVGDVWCKWVCCMGWFCVGMCGCVMWVVLGDGNYVGCGGWGREEVRVGVGCWVRN